MKIIGRLDVEGNLDVTGLSNFEQGSTYFYSKGISFLDNINNTDNYELVATIGGDYFGREIIYNASDHYYHLFANDNTLIIYSEDSNYNESINFNTGALWVEDYGRDLATHNSIGILPKDGQIYYGNKVEDFEYTYTLPEQSGTLALASQIPTVNNGILTIQAEGTTKGTFTANQSTNTTVNITKEDFVQTKTYTGLIGTSNEYKNATFYFINVMPDSWNKEWSVTYRIEVNLDNGLTPTNYQKMSSTHECYIGGSRGYNQTYAFFNSINDPSYRTVFYHIIHETTEDGFNNNYPHKIGVELTSSSYPANADYKRTIKVTILNTTNCTVTLLDSPEIPVQSDRTDYTKINSTYYPNSVNGNAPGYALRGDLYSQGLRETGDDNSTDQMYYHNQWMTISSDLGLQGSCIFGLNTSGEIMPISVSNPSAPSDTINISTTRVYNEGGFDWSRGLMHCINGGYYTPATTNLIHSFKVQSFDFRYTDNNLNADNTALTIKADKFIYLRGTIGSDGLFYLAPMEVTYNNQTYKRAWTQEIPSSEDGYIYWLIGHPYSGSSASAYVYNVRLYAENPLFWFKDGKFRQYESTYVGVKRFI